jgi:hypothetical protein
MKVTMLTGRGRVRLGAHGRGCDRESAVAEHDPPYARHAHAQHHRLLRDYGEGIAVGGDWCLLYTLKIESHIRCSYIVVSITVTTTTTTMTSIIMTTTTTIIIIIITITITIITITIITITIMTSTTSPHPVSLVRRPSTGTGSRSCPTCWCSSHPCATRARSWRRGGSPPRTSSTPCRHVRTLHLVACTEVLWSLAGSGPGSACETFTFRLQDSTADFICPMPTI